MRAYRLLTTLLAPVAQWHLHRRRQGVPPNFSKPNFRGGKSAAKTPQKPSFSPENRPIWLHCASAGEVVAAQPLIEALLAANHPLVVSLWSPNGAIKLQQLFGEQVPWVWLPWDTPRAMERLVDLIQPAQLWIMETEIWPHMLLAAHQAGVPITYVNGRLTDNTLRAPRWLQAAYRAGLQQVNKVLARGEPDAKRFEKLGVPAERIQVAGNLKWLAAAQLIDQPPIPLRATPHYLFASIYRDEAEQFLPLLAERRLEIPWVLVPRRPEQDANTLARLARAAGLSTALIENDQQAAQSTANILIETRFGTLTRWMAGAEVVVMGGSFTPHGGHNFLEAAALGKPIILGPHMEDFEEETALFRHHNALIQAQMPENVLKALKEASHQRGLNAQALLQQQQQAIWNHYAQALGLT